jgi:hypothetical protein
MRKRNLGRLFLPVAGAVLVSALFFVLASCKEESEPARSGNKITGFEINGRYADISETTITVPLSQGAALSQSPTVTVSPGAKVISPKSTAQAGGGGIFVPDAAVDFSSGPVNWTVQAENGALAQYNVTVTAPVLTGIQITKLPQTVFSYNAAFTFAGLELDALYSAGAPVGVTSGYTVSGGDTALAGERDVLVSYQGKTASYKITVLEKEEAAILNSIIVTSKPAKTVYDFGEDLDLTGLVVTGTLSDNSTVEYQKDDPLLIVSGYDASVEGYQTVLLSVKNKTAALSVSVRNSADRLTAWDFLESKTLYGYLEDVVPAADFVLKGWYANRASKEVILDLDTEVPFVEGFKAQTPGSQTLLVTVADITHELRITVREPALVSLDVAGLEEAYPYGYIIVTSDLTVTGTYEGSAAEVLEEGADAGEYAIDYDFSGEPGDQTITVTVEDPVTGEDVVFETTVTVEVPLEVTVSFGDPSDDGFSIGLPADQDGPGISFPLELQDPEGKTAFVLSAHKTGGKHDSIIIRVSDDFYATVDTYSVSTKDIEWKVDGAVIASGSQSVTLNAAVYTVAYKTYILNLTWAGDDGDDSARSNTRYTKSIKFKVVY